MKILTHRNLVGPIISRLRRKRGWTQADFAVHLQLAGWNISRSGVAKMEAQLAHVGDRELCYLRQVLRVDVKELFPPLDPHKSIRQGIAELLTIEPAGELTSMQ
jgi:transcriptional regulator with XRE-family HTH domain